MIAEQLERSKWLIDYEADAVAPRTPDVESCCRLQRSLQVSARPEISGRVESARSCIHGRSIDLYRHLSSALRVCSPSVVMLLVDSQLPSPTMPSSATHSLSESRAHCLICKWLCFVT